MDILKGSLTISKVSSSANGDYVSIELIDKDSRERVRANLSIEEFGQALLGLACRPCDIEAKHPERIGLRRESMPIKVKVKTHDKELGAAALKDATPEGWKVDSYLGSQSSFFVEGNQLYARSAAYRWVEKD